MSEARDRDLGMACRIRRRDFLNGVALTAGASLASPGLLRALEAGDEPYPPALTGMRGSHDGSYETAHLLRDSSFWKTVGPARDTGESYDLVVVGAGISGLAGAWFFRQAAGSADRLLLDNHDDSSINVWWLGPFQLTAWGENWHRNHHSEPGSARFGRGVVADRHRLVCDPGAGDGWPCGRRPRRRRQRPRRLSTRWLLSRIRLRPGRSR